MRKLIIAIVCLCVVFVAGFGSYRGYKIWKEKRLVKMARQFIAKSDGANAVLCLRKALQANPNNLEACRMMADFAELARSPQAVIWRSRLVDLEPTSFTNRLNLARAAVAAGDTATAQKALEGVEERDKKTATFNNTSGAVDLAAGRYTDAEAHFLEATRLDPTSPALQLNLASLRLQKKDPTAVAEARAVLQGLCTNREVRSEALRQLALDSARHTNMPAALACSQQLIQETNAAFTDRMLHLEILRVSHHAQEPSYLATLQAEARENPAKAYEVGKWMLASGKPLEGLAWIKTLAPATRTNPPLPLVETDCYLATKNWAGLLTNTASQNWADLDCLRLAARCRAYKEQGMNAAAKTEWLAALKAAGTRAEVLGQLLNTVTLWKWEPEQEDVFWAIINRYPGEKPILRALSERLMTTGKTRSLMTLYALALQDEKDNPAYINNLAVSALLLEAWDKKPHELALTAYTKAPTNASFASTYAYSLLVQKKPTEALQVMDKLSPEALADPGVAAYYGVILSATGNSPKAKKYLDMASKAPLLPEEQKLVDQARKAIKN